jgi:4a-hydroxytetrahydrobiopterin dehydratase
MATTASASDLVQKSCRDCAGEAKKLEEIQVRELLTAVPQWQRNGQAISRAYKFKNYYETMAFVNAVAWIAHGEDHHPDLAVGYNTCAATYSTHSAGGLTENDFICAAKVDALLGSQ